MLLRIKISLIYNPCFDDDDDDDDDNLGLRELTYRLTYALVTTTIREWTVLTACPAAPWVSAAVAPCVGIAAGRGRGSVRSNECFSSYLLVHSPQR